MAQIRYTFKKDERLCNVRHIEQLFSGDNPSFVKYPLRIIFSQGKGINKVLISVPKKRFRHAVDRNRIKRLIREAYRLNKHLSKSENLHIAFLYLDTQLPDYHTVELSMVSALNKINELCENS